RPEGIWSTAFTDVQLAAGVRSLTLSPQDTSDPCTDLGDTGLVYCASNITPEEEFRDSILRDGEIFTAVGGAVTSGLALAGANTGLNYTKDLGKTLADVLGPTTTTSTTLPHPDGGCCVQNNGCPGETPNSCANTAGCCCCPEGQTCCADHALGCCG